MPSLPLLVEKLDCDVLSIRKEVLDMATSVDPEIAQYLEKATNNLRLASKALNRAFFAAKRVEAKAEILSVTKD